MLFWDKNFSLSKLLKFKEKKPPLRIGTRFLRAMIPAVVLVLAGTGYALYINTSNYLSISLQRYSRAQVQSMGYEIENILDEARKDILYLARKAHSPEQTRNFFQISRNLRQRPYCAIIYLPTGEGKRFSLFIQDDKLQELSGVEVGLLKPDPLLLVDEIEDLSPGEVTISELVTAKYPIVRNGVVEKRSQRLVWRLATPVFKNGQKQGYFILAMDARYIRNRMSLFNSPDSPVWSVARTPELRYYFLFNPKGWIIFESEEKTRENIPLQTRTARQAYSGILGKPGIDFAFQPGTTQSQYWKMVNEVLRGEHGSMLIKDSSNQSKNLERHFLAYTPVKFHPQPGEEEIVAGLAYIDRSRLPLDAGYQMINYMFVITLCAIVLLTLIIFCISRRITRPILDLARKVNKIRDIESVQPLEVRNADYETSILAQALNNMMEHLNQTLQKLHIRESEIRDVALKERVDPENFLHQEHDRHDFLTEIVGGGPQMENVKMDILKAARADVDVLLQGETGTGKQLAAEAIHANSERSTHPFISINCGALDENLLLDTLFGHVKGAFTEAKTERKGAFLDADKGTLFLDEIQAASPRVQQSLLRAVAMRKIKPLGNDKEIDVDVRLLAATNLNLQNEISAGRFREDLYYRLKIINIHIPPLREHSDNISILAFHFLHQAGDMINKKDLGLSKGALEKLNDYHWPGNIRELKNCITRAAVMAEEETIYSRDIILEQQPAPDQETREESGKQQKTEPANAEKDAERSGPGGREKGEDEDRKKFGKTMRLPEGINIRQKNTLLYLKKNEYITRRKYQELNNGLSPRTANHDLQDLVKREILQKQGRGPAVKYLPGRNYSN